MFRDKKEESLHTLHAWTLVEAYAKLRDTNPFPLLSGTTFFPDAGFATYCIDEQAVLSLAWDPVKLKKPCSGLIHTLFHEENPSHHLRQAVTRMFVHEFLENSTKKHPEKTALIWGDRELQLSGTRCHGRAVCLSL